MAKVTDRYDNKNLINLAKQQYTKKQSSKIPSELIKLPSSGVIYPMDSPLRQGLVEMRHMTAFDEDILTNFSYISEGVVFDKLLESLVITDTPILEISNVDREALIINARIVAYGDDYPVVVTHPTTKKQINTSIKLSELKYKSMDLETDDNGDCTYVCEDKSVIKFTYAPKPYDTKKGTNVISSFLISVITEINESKDPNYIKEFLQYNFPFKESKKFQKHVTSNMPGLIKEVEVEGEDGGTFFAGFQIGSDLFWPKS